MNSRNPVNVYRHTQIKTASQGQLILMLYDGAVRQIDEALELLPQKQRKFDVVNGCIIKAQDIVGELMASLDFEKGGEIAKNLFALYLFMNRLLLEANLRKETGPLRDVRRMLLELRGAWAQVTDKAPKTVSEGSGVDIAG